MSVHRPTMPQAAAPVTREKDAAFARQLQADEARLRAELAAMGASGVVTIRNTAAVRTSESLLQLVAVPGGRAR